MTKLIRQFRNKSKALELKLEQEELNRYQITLAGITVNVNACASGACGDNYFVDTETYIHQTFPDLNLAEQVYDNYKTLYLDQWMEQKEQTLLKFSSRKLKLKIKLSYAPQTKLYTVHQNNFKSNFKKLSAAIYVFEDQVFRTFNNQLPLAEWVCDAEKK